MGAMMIFDMDFETKGDRLKFEAYLKKKHIGTRKLTDYCMDDDTSNYVVYYVGFLGYAEPEMIRDDCLNEGIKFKLFAWLDISVSHNEWEKIRGRWS